MDDDITAVTNTELQRKITRRDEKVDERHDNKK